MKLILSVALLFLSSNMFGQKNPTLSHELKKANDAYAEKRYDEAFAIYKKLAENGNDTAMLKIGVCYDKGDGVGQNIVLANEWYQKAIAKGNNDAMGYLAWNYDFGPDSIKNNEKAIYWYQRAINENNDVSAFINLANIYRIGEKAPKDEKKALSLLKRASAIDSANMATRLVGEYYQNGWGVMKDIDSALYWYQKADRAGSYKVQEKLGDLYFDRQKYKEAARAYRKGLIRFPDNTNLQSGLGNTLYALDSLDAAIDAYKKAIQINPKLYVSVYNIASAYYNLENNDSAKLYYNRVTELVPNYFKGQLNLGVVYYDQKLYDSAVVHFRKAIEIQPLAIAFSNIGNAFTELNIKDSALFYYHKSLAVDSDYRDTYPLLAHFYENHEKNYDSCIYYYQQCLFADPFNRELLSHIGYQYLYQGKDVDRALGYFMEESKMHPDDYHGYYDVACYYSLQKNSPAALASLQSAFQYGFSDHKHVMSDSDLDNIKMEPEFKSLMDKYFKRKP